MTTIRPMTIPTPVWVSFDGSVTSPVTCGQSKPAGLSSGAFSPAAACPRRSAGSCACVASGRRPDGDAGDSQLEAWVPETEVLAPLDVARRSGRPAPTGARGDRRIEGPGPVPVC